MSQRFTNVSTGSPKFADADNPSPERAPRKPRLQGEAGAQRILFLDDDPDRARAFLLRRPDAVWVETAEDCIARLEEFWDQVHLDHDLGGEVFVDSNRPDCGMEVVRWLCNVSSARFQNTLFIIHTYNAEAGEAMVRSLCESNYEAVYRPFGDDLIECPLDDELEENDEEELVRPAKPAWSEWIRRLSRKLWPGTPAANAEPAAEDSSQPGRMLEDASGDDPARQ
jgi:hypothetical protein